MNVLNLFDGQDTWLGSLKRFKRDGREFKKQAVNCCDWYVRPGGNLAYRYAIGGRNALEKRQDLFSFLRSCIKCDDKYDRINFFCHGSPRHLNRMMISMDKKNRMGKVVRRGNIEKFCALLSGVAAPGCKIVFYSCKTAKLDDGFAATVASLTGCDVIGHTTSGHTTRNPFKRWFSTESEQWQHDDSRMWKWYCGIRAMKKRLAFNRKKPDSKFAPFEFVDEVFRGEK